MIWRRILTLSALGLALGGCHNGAHPPAFFATNAPEGERVLAACSRGDLTGPVCANARAGRAAAERAAREASYRRSFQ